MLGIKVKVKNEGMDDSSAFEEELIVRSKDTAKEDVQEILDGFNRYQKSMYGDKAEKRVIVSIDISDDGDEKYYCHFVKDNLVSNSDGSDTYKCKGCGRKVKRSSLDWSPPKILCKVQPKKSAKKIVLKIKRKKKRRILRVRKKK